MPANNDAFDWKEALAAIFPQLTTYFEKKIIKSMKIKSDTFILNISYSFFF